MTTRFTLGGLRAPRTLGLLALLAVTAVGQPAYIGPAFFNAIGTGVGNMTGAQTADLDNDGDADAVFLRGNTIVALINDGTGSFAQIPSAGPGSGFSRFALGDFNGDNLPDIVNSRGNLVGTISLWFNQGNGTFAAGQTLSVAGGLNNNVTVLNLNPAVDGDLDFVVIETTGGLGRIRRYGNDGSGTFTYLGSVGSLSGFNGSQVYSADMDGDNDEDLVATYQGGFMVNDRLYVYFNDGAGNFGSSFNIQLTATAYNNPIVLKDVTGDTRPDIVSANLVSVVTYVNSGTGTIGFTQITPTSLGTICGIDAADIDGDGNADAFVVDTTAPYGAEYLAGNGNGTFNGTPLPLSGTNPNPCTPNLADLNGDGTPDCLFSVLGGATPSLGTILFGVEPVNFRKVMLTEVSWGNPDFVEIANFALTTQNLSGWTLEWKDGSTTTSMPLNITLQPGEPAVIGEPNTIALLGLPGAIQVLDAFPTNIGTTSGDFVVALRDGNGIAIDEVRVSNTGGGYGEGSLGGYFRGLATRANNGGTASLERIWGLDSNSGTDWTDQAVRTPGYENTSSGPRGTDTVPVLTVLINETDDNPDLIELYNPNTFSVDLTSWTLWCDATQGGNHTILTPFTTATVLGAGEYLVIGETTTPPAEIPGGVTYIDVTQNIPWATAEYDCALYDAHGRLVDLMRTTGADDVLVHNHPRAPAHWADFRGAAGRLDGGGDDAIARRFATDSNQGSDFDPVYQRTMGFANSGFASFDVGHATELDVRFNDHALHGGHSMIVNAGAANAGMKYSYFVSIGHFNGVGPFIGLGGDAIVNWINLSPIFPFGANLQADGSHTIHLPPVTSLPPGFDFDIVGILQDPAGGLLTRTLVIEFDTF